MLCPLRRLALRLCVDSTDLLGALMIAANKRAPFPPTRALLSVWFHSHTCSPTPVTAATAWAHYSSHCADNSQMTRETPLDLDVLNAVGRLSR
jgi:hypothetical protein